MTLAELKDRIGCDTDKSVKYLNHYEQYFAPLVNQPIKLLELGVKTGGSIQLWHEYFTHDMRCIIGIDKELVPEDSPALYCNRAELHQVDQTDRMLLFYLAKQWRSLDIIIDDASHIAEYTAISFDVLFPFLKSGGLYCIEDWGTGYNAEWTDGSAKKPLNLQLSIGNRCGHSSGMVGLVKQIIDLLDDGIVRADIIGGLAIFQKR